MNQEFSISSKGEALSGKTSILHANAERMNILEALGADIVSLEMSMRQVMDKMP